MADYLVAMDRQNIRPRFFPLVHDMIPLHEFAHPRQSMFARNFAHDNGIVIRHAEKVMTNSVFTKSELEHFAASGHLPALPPLEPVLLPHELRETNEDVEVSPPQTPTFWGLV